MLRNESTQSGLFDSKWNLRNLPPENDKDVAAFCWHYLEVGLMERDRLDLPNRWKYATRMCRSSHWTNKTGNPKDRFKLSIGLIFSNKQRIVANITSRNPVAEVLDLDGYQDGQDKVLSAYLQRWWKDTFQRNKMVKSADRMEEYGVTIEKAYWDAAKERPNTSVYDCYGYVPAPGYYEDPAAQLPYAAFLQPMLIEDIEAQFGVEGVIADDMYSILGSDREEIRPPVPGSTQSDVQYTGGKRAGSGSARGQQVILQGRCLTAEMWFRDLSTDENGDLKYPGGIRCITLTRTRDAGSGHQYKPVVLSDRPNPSINRALPIEAQKASFLYDRFPLHIGTSYNDPISNWGFSATEQVGDIALRIDELFSKLVAWMAKSLSPMFVCPKGIGITKQQIANRVNLVLMPNRPININTMGYLPTPNLPASFFQIVDMLIKTAFDRPYAVEDADRGEVPRGVIAAAAIVALQERNAVMIQHKMEAIEGISEFRGRSAISLLQNFGLEPETLDVDDETVSLTGHKLAGRRYGYVVESGSTMPKTSLQVQAQAEKFHEMGAIGDRDLLEVSNFPNWKRIVERKGEGQLGQAIQVLVEAGLPEDKGQQLYEVLMQHQGGPGDKKKSSTSQSSAEAGAQLRGVTA